METHAASLEKGAKTAIRAQSAGRIYSKSASEKISKPSKAKAKAQIKPHPKRSHSKAKQNENEVKGEARVKPSQAQAKPEESESESKQSRRESEAKPSNLKQSQTEPMQTNAREMKKTDIGQA